MTVAAPSGPSQATMTGEVPHPHSAPDGEAMIPTELADELGTLLHTDPAGCRERALALVADEDPGRRLVGSHYEALVARLRGEDAVALAACDRTEHLAAELGEPIWQARALACRGLVHHDVGDAEEAVDLLRRAVGLCRAQSSRSATAEMLGYLGHAYAAMPPFAPQAAGALTEARRLWIAAGDLDGAAGAQVTIAMSYVAASTSLARSNPRGGMAAARRALVAAQQAVDEADAAGLAGPAVDARLAVAGAHALLGDDVAVGKALDSAASLLSGFPNPAQLLALHRLRAQWWVRTGEPDRARQECAAGLEVCHTLPRPADRAALLTTLVDALEDAGDVAGALSVMHELHDMVSAQAETVAERRAALLSTRLEVEDARRAAETERRRAAALEAYNARLAWDASHDQLTGLVNRRGLDAELDLRVAQAERPFAVALVDIDHFKRINDECSHQVGDRVLARLGDTLGKAVRGGDIAARYGGEEFALVLAGADLATATTVCDRIRARISGMQWSEPVPGGRVTMSMGVVACTGGDSVADLLAAADAALYRAKRGGRDRVEAAG